MISLPIERPEPHLHVGSPRIAVVIPIFKHSVFLIEAIESILAQDASWPISIVLVNDGCTHHETDVVCRMYAYRYPEIIFYQPKPNGGLSDARNHGIQFALEKWPDLEAIYLLDADNKLRPPALRKAMAALDAHPDADWIYPNIDMFGLSWSGDYGGDYSRLIHTQMNICEAGSLVHRRVFDAGVFFDTSFKAGFEDWDFFLSAGDAGFRGKNIEDFGFQYRKRGESMLSGSERKADALRARIEEKHAALFSPQSLLKLEQQEAPRYAIFVSGKDKVILTVDPEHPQRQELLTTEFWGKVHRALLGNTRHHLPAYFVFCDGTVWDTLQNCGLLHSTLWKLEREISDEVPITTAVVGNGKDDRLVFRCNTPISGQAVEGSVLMCAVASIEGMVREQNVLWFQDLLRQGHTIRSKRLDVLVPESIFGKLLPVGTKIVRSLIEELANACAMPAANAASFVWEWRHSDIHWRRRGAEITAKAVKATSAFPRIVETPKHIGMILPLVEFGGVERVALNMARTMKQRGYKLHLFVTDAESIHFNSEWHAAFDSVTFLSDPNYATWGKASARYFGTEVSDWSRWGQVGNAVSMLNWLDIAINFHSAAMSGVMGQLQKLGVVTVQSLHLSDRTPFNRPLGNTYNALAFEHGYDCFVTCSNALADWCHAMGIPEDKIIPVPNAPSFELPTAATWPHHAMPETDEDGTRPLRVLYIGRLDPQKGLDRLEVVVEKTLMGNDQFEWRVIGKSVIADGAAPLSPDLSRRLEPVKNTPEELADVYAWADVMVILSEYEGLPLTILEAMRQGCVVIATDVGAVSEVLHDGENGILLSRDAAIEGCLTALKRLAADRRLLRRLSEQAANNMQGRDWGAAMARFLNSIEIMN